MTSYLSRRADVFVAPENNYGRENADVTSYCQIRPEQEGFEHSGKTPLLARNLVSTGLDPFSGVPGAPSCTVGLNVAARGGGVATQNGQQAGLCPELAGLLAGCVSGTRRDMGAKVQSAGLATLELLSATPNSRFTPGGLVFVETPGVAGTVGRWISALDDVARTLTLAGHWRGGAAWNLPAIPDFGAAIYAATHLKGDAQTPASLCMAINGLPRPDAGPLWWYTGLLGNLKIEDSAAGERVLLGFTYSGDCYGVSTGTPRVSLAAGAKAWPAHPGDLRALSADFRIDGEPTAYRSFSLDLGNRYTERLNANRESGRDGHVLTGREVTGSCVVYWDAAHQGRLVAGQAVDISWIVGSAANGLGFHAPCCELREVSERDLGGLMGMELKFAVLRSDIPAVPAWMLSFSGTPAAD